MAKLVKMVQKESDTELADQIRAKIVQLAALMDIANGRGLAVGFSINIDPVTGKNVGASTIQRVTDL